MRLNANKQVALQSFHVIEACDAAMAVQCIAPDFVNQEAEDDPDDVDRNLRGPAGFIATVHWLSTAFSDLKFEHIETLAQDQRVAVLTVMTGRHTGTFQRVPPTGKRFQQRQFHLFRLHEGKIVAHVAQRDDLGLLLHLGWRSHPAR